MLLYFQFYLFFLIFLYPQYSLHTYLGCTDIQHPAVRIHKKCQCSPRNIKTEPLTAWNRQLNYQKNTKETCFCCCCNAACVQQVVLWCHAYLPFRPCRTFQDRKTWNRRAESWTCLSFNCCSSCLRDGASVWFWFWFGASEPFWLNKDEAAEVLLPQWCDNTHPLKALSWYFPVTLADF